MLIIRLFLIASLFMFALLADEGGHLDPNGVTVCYSACLDPNG